MKLAFSLDTHGTCVGQLRDELLPLEELAKTWKFPYDIHFVLCVLPESYGRKTCRCFDSRDRALDLDISIIYEQYQRMSKNEQREAAMREYENPLLHKQINEGACRGMLLLHFSPIDR